jgi:hypothetical protein
MNKKFDFKDITLIPETLSSIRSRSEINVYNEYGFLPIMVSPMDTVVDSSNINLFYEKDLFTCAPRGVNSNNQYVFKSISLEDFETIVSHGVKTSGFLLIDIANGHMKSLYDLCVEFSKNNDLSKVMVGNIANPKTYNKFAKIGVGYIRVGIGGGSGCLTSANTGVHFPMASLISECYNIKKNNEYTTKIVADGGFRNYDEIIKALALGADYVMLGGLLNKTLESCSDIKLFNRIKISHELGIKIWEKFPKMRKHFYKEFRGMSTKAVQKKWGKSKLKTSEGIHKVNKVEYRLDQWISNFKDYLKSAMSYTNSMNLESFKESEYVFITENALKRFDK